MARGSIQRQQNVPRSGDEQSRCRGTVTTTLDRRSHRLAMVVGPLLMVFSVGYAIAGGVVSAERYVAFLVGTGSFLATGLVAWHRRPGNRTGRLLVAIGLCAALEPIR